MAATITSSLMDRDVPNPVQMCNISTLQDNVSVTVTLLGPSGVVPRFVSYVLTTPPADNSLVGMSWTASSCTLGGTNTITVVFHGSGSLTSAVAKLRIEWGSVATGGTSA